MKHIIIVMLHETHQVYCKTSSFIAPYCRLSFSSQHLNLAHRMHVQKMNNFLDESGSVFPEKT